MSHFTSILENIRLVAIKRSPLSQQKQSNKEQQSSTSHPPSNTATITITDTDLLQQQQADIHNEYNKSSKVLNTTTSARITTSKTISSNAHAYQHEDQADKGEIANNSYISGNVATNAISGTSVKAHSKRQSVSARGSISSGENVRTSPGRERNVSNRTANLIAEIDINGSNSSVSGVKNSVTRTRDLSPSPKNQQRRMSTDFRARAGSFIHVDDEGRSILMRKPVRLKNIEGRPEVYDTLHFKGKEVSMFAYIK